MSIISFCTLISLIWQYPLYEKNQSINVAMLLWKGLPDIEVICVDHVTVDHVTVDHVTVY